MFDIVNAGYERRLNYRHQAHHANRYHCFSSDGDTDTDEEIKQTVSTPTFFGITSGEYDLSYSFLDSKDPSPTIPSTIFTCTPSTFFPSDLYSDPDTHHSGYLVVQAIILHRSNL